MPTARVINPNAKNAVKIGTLCVAAYFAVYIVRNVLGAVTPQMAGEGYTEAYVGKISSLFFVAYAVGQLINGAVSSIGWGNLILVWFGLMVVGVIVALPHQRWTEGP